MTGQVPSYLVRNLIEVTLSKTEPKPAKKTRLNQTLCLAIPSKSFKKQDDSLEDVKALLKLHRRFENDAKRTVYNGMVETDRERVGFNSDASSCGVSHKKGEAKQGYLKEIHSKLALPSSPELPALPGAENLPKQLEYYPEKHLDFSKKTRKKDKGVILPALTDKPFHSGQSLYGNEQILQENSKLKDHEKLDGKSFENFNLHEDLTIISLNKKNFASYDSLTTLYGVRPKRNSRSDVRKSRNTKPPLGIFIPFSETRSEDGLFVDIDEYLKDTVDEKSQVSSRGNAGNEYSELDGEPTKQSLALVEYRPIYRKNVHFSEVLHEVHLYSPVQNHRRRRRHKLRHTEDAMEEPTNAN